MILDVFLFRDAPTQNQDAITSAPAMMARAQVLEKREGEREKGAGEHRGAEVAASDVGLPGPTED